MNFDFDAWECPSCGYIISDTQMQSFRADYGCPRCGTAFATFIPKPATPPNNQINSDAKSAAGD